MSLLVNIPELMPDPSQQACQMGKRKEAYEGSKDQMHELMDTGQ